MSRRLSPDGKVGMFSYGLNRDPITIRVNGMFYTYYSANPGTTFNAADLSVANLASRTFDAQCRPGENITPTCCAGAIQKPSRGRIKAGNRVPLPPNARSVYYYGNMDIITSSGRSIMARTPRPASIAPKIPPTLASMTTAIWWKPFPWRRRKSLNPWPALYRRPAAEPERHPDRQKTGLREPRP